MADSKCMALTPVIWAASPCFSSNEERMHKQLKFKKHRSPVTEPHSSNYWCTSIHGVSLLPQAVSAAVHWTTLWWASEVLTHHITGDLGQESPSWGLLSETNTNQTIPFCSSKIAFQEPQLLCVNTSILELLVFSPSLPALVLPALVLRDAALHCFNSSLSCFPISAGSESPRSFASPATAALWIMGTPNTLSIRYSHSLPPGCSHEPCAHLGSL